MFCAKSASNFSSTDLLKDKNVFVFTNFNASNSSNIIVLFKLIFLETNINDLLQHKFETLTNENVCNEETLKNVMEAISTHLNICLNNVVYDNYNFTCFTGDVDEAIKKYIHAKSELTKNSNYCSQYFEDEIIKYNFKLGSYIQNNDDMSSEQKRILIHMRYMLDFCSLYLTKLPLSSSNNSEYLALRFFIEKRCDKNKHTNLVSKFIKSYEIINSKKDTNFISRTIKDKVLNNTPVYMLKWVDPIFALNSGKEISTQEIEMSASLIEGIFIDYVSSINKFNLRNLVAYRTNYSINEESNKTIEDVFKKINQHGLRLFDQ
ncbi:hypothetical protein COBT_002062 [Conglomerata obtusa]